MSSTPTQIKIHASVFFLFLFRLFKNKKVTPATVTQMPTISEMIEITCIVSALDRIGKQQIYRFATVFFHDKC